MGSHREGETRGSQSRLLACRQQNKASQLADVQAEPEQPQNIPAAPHSSAPGAGSEGRSTALPRIRFANYTRISAPVYRRFCTINSSSSEVWSWQFELEGVM